MPTTSIQPERRLGLERAWQVLWLLIASVVLFSTLNGRVVDRDWTPFSDQSSHLLAAMSVWHDRDLKFEKTDLDRFNARFPAAGGPKGTFLKQSPDGDFFYAKPVLYALLTAPFYGLFGTSGFILCNLLAIALMASLTYRITRPVFGTWQSHGMTAALFLLGPFMAWTMVIHPDILISALLFGGGYLLLTGTTRTALLAAGCLLGMALYEKPTFAVILPFLFVAMPSLSLRKLVLAAVGVLVGWLLPTAINLSQDANMLAYQGLRIYFPTGPFPFELGWEAPKEQKYAHFFDPVQVLSALMHNIVLLPQKLFDLVAARQTGLALYFPVALLFFGTAIIQRRPRSLIVCSALVAYYLLNALAFPTNGFGGSQSYGSRYLLQALPLTILALLPIDRHASRRERAWIFAPLSLAAIFGTLILQHQTLPPSSTTVEDPTPFLTHWPATLFPLEVSLLPSVPIHSPQFRVSTEDLGTSLFRIKGFDHGVAAYSEGRAKMTIALFQHNVNSALPEVAITTTIAATATARIGTEVIWRGAIDPTKETVLNIREQSLKQGAFDLIKREYTRWDTVDIELVASSEGDGPAFAWVGFKNESLPHRPILDLDIDSQAFSSQGIERRLGWSHDPGWTQWTWTDGPYAELHVPVPAGVSGAMNIGFTAHAFLAPGHEQQQVEVYINGKHTQNWRFDSPEIRRLVVTVDNAAPKDIIRLGFKPLNPAVPQDLGLGKDMRALGLALHSIRISNNSNKPAGNP